MTDAPLDRPDRDSEDILHALQERAKELNCLYRVDEILSRRDRPEREIYVDLLAALPEGWRYPEVCVAALEVGGRVYRPEGFLDSPWRLAADVLADGARVGTLTVYYTEKRPAADGGPFLKEERRLLHAVAERIGLFLMQEQLRRAQDRWPGAMESISRKMVNHLYWSGVPGAPDLLQEFGTGLDLADAEDPDENRPRRKHALRQLASLTQNTFELAGRHLPEAEILDRIQAWIKEEKTGAVLNVLENPNTGLTEAAEAVEKFQAEVEEQELSPTIQKSLHVSLLRRCFTDQMDFINLAKHYVEVRDFADLLRRLLVPARGQGTLGGKSRGLFLAGQIVRRAVPDVPLLAGIRIPETWYVASDSLLEFMRHNNLDDLYNRKYMEPERIRQDYPFTVQLFKNSHFPPEMAKGLTGVLDEVGDSPLIVRSSSLLEDRAGSAFSGKHKSLSLANQGTRPERLEALLDAVAEVYASVFGPDPIEYRAERELLDVNEEMAIMVQKVVGRRFGDYFFPAFSGVGFSYNTYRWSPRIRREDGLLRLVPGLGTRAVDRLSDEETVRDAPRMMDVIDLKARTFRTMETKDLLRRLGDQIPGGGATWSRCSVRRAYGVLLPWGPTGRRTRSSSPSPGS